MRIEWEEKRRINKEEDEGLSFERNDQVKEGNEDKIDEENIE